ncbi:LAFE_0G08592g1_1 [Lachancea fermentati]|uniref:Kinesin-like protein n=1 Tax=Lachancea fermentati TaxID=4955 RepID=A0A1G4MHX0_LACFM|nr:LAFE_0G08592g1_1 [Lachancea fermentati]
MIHKSPTRRHTTRATNGSIPQTPRIRHAGSFSSLRRKSSVTPLATPLTTPLATPRSVSSGSRHSSQGDSRGSRHSSPTRSSRSSSPTRTTGGTHTEGARVRAPAASYRGTISVSVRIKPSDAHSRDAWTVGDEPTVGHPELGEFRFDHVFRPAADNRHVHDRIGRPLIDKLFEGYNATVFAYGMTGSGKTFTMSGDGREPGLILLSVEQIFARIAGERARDPAAAPAAAEPAAAELAAALRRARDYSVSVSYLEIYNEKIYDLLNCGAAPREWNAGGAASAPAELKVRDDARRGVTVVGLTEQPAASSADVLKWVALGNSNRRTGETDYNTRSSRSHAVVQVRVVATDAATRTQTTSTLSLCDLAGSERAAGQHERRKEGAFINRSLLALGTVISKLSAIAAQPAPAPAAAHIPYRDSKLTRILQPALSGDSIVTTICTIDTRTESVAETVNTLRFASRAKNVALAVRRNDAAPAAAGAASATDPSAQRHAHVVEALRRQLDEQQEVLEEQQRQLEAFRRGATDPAAGPTALPGAAPAPDSPADDALLQLRLQHCEKLLELDHAPLHDPELLEIVEMLPAAVGAVLEAKLQRYESQLREHRAYTQQLEHRVAVLEASAAHDSIVARLDAGATADTLVRDQEAELLELRRALARKDKMLEALQSAKRLREHALRPVPGGQLNAGRGRARGEKPGIRAGAGAGADNAEPRRAG